VYRACSYLSVRSRSIRVNALAKKTSIVNNVDVTLKYVTALAANHSSTSIDTENVSDTKTCQVPDTENVSGTVVWIFQNGQTVKRKKCQVPLFGFFMGRPRGRNVDSRPSREAVRFCQGSVPYG
jgi:hypothetical protein